MYTSYCICVKVPVVLCCFTIFYQGVMNFISDTEQLLLAGVMGAVVTLLVIALAIAAVAVRLCINKRRREERDENDNLHRNSSTHNM